MMASQLPHAVAALLANCRAELGELYAIVQQEQKKKLQRWQDEEPMLECQIEALSGTRDIIQREQKQLTSELANLKAFLEKQAAEAGPQAGNGPSGAAAGAQEEARLQEQLQELTAKIAELDDELTGLVPKLSGGPGGGCRPDELSYYETKLVVIQDTRRLLQSESTALAAELKRRQAAARLAADQHTAAHLGLSDLGRLGERLAGVEAALDRAKVERYFPAQRGFRFSGGGGGVYCGVKDLHLSEVSGAFSISLEAVPAASSSGSSSGSNAQREVRLKVTLSGIAAAAGSRQYKQQQEQQKQQQAAKAAAQAKSLKRQQAYQQQQQQHGSPLRRSTTALHQQQSSNSPSQQYQGGSPMRQQHAGPGSSSNWSGGSGGGSKRNAAITKFLGQLTEKKDALSNAIKSSPLTKGLEGSQSPAGGSTSPAGFSRHLASTFGDKAAGFSSRREQQGSAAGGSPEQGLLGALAGGTGAAGSSDSLPGSANGGSTGGSTAANRAAAAAAGDGGGPESSINGSTNPGRPAAADISLSEPSTPAKPGLEGSARMPAAEAAEASPAALPAQLQQSPSAGHSHSQLGVQNRAESISSTGSSSSGWAQQEGRQHDLQSTAKLGSMKGKFGDFLSSSKQKLQDSKQKLADSKLVQESRQKLAESKQKLAESTQKLADSKIFVESRTAAKNLLEDSRHLLEDSQAGIKKGIANLQDKQQQQTFGTPRSSIDRQQQQQLQQQQQQQQSPGPPSVALQTPAATPAGGALHAADHQEAAPAAAAVAVAAATPPAAATDAPEVAGLADNNVSPSNENTLLNQQQQGQSEASMQDQPSQIAAAAAAQGSTSSQATAATAAAASFPGVTAASAAAASSGDLDRQLLDEAWVGDEQGGVYAGGSSSSSSSSSGSSAWLPGTGAAAASAGVAGGKGSGSRKGVVVMLLAEGLEILGEKGTKVPNIRAARLGLEVECVLSATLTYSSTLGWQSAGLAFEVVSLERVVEGSNIPVPKTLIKSVLNLVMPSVFTKLLLTSLPHELGQFILDSAATAATSSSSTAGSAARPRPGDASPTSAAAAAVAAAGGAGVWLSGELCLTGPPLVCLSACLTRSAEEVPAGNVSLTNFVQELRAAQQARALINIPDPLHARALALLFTPGSPFCLLDTPTAAAVGSSAPAAAAGIGSTVLGTPASLTLRDLCRFYVEFADSAVWGDICEMWQVAVDAVCLQLAREDGLLPSSDASSVPSQPTAQTAAAAAGSCGPGAAQHSADGVGTAPPGVQEPSSGSSNSKSSRVAQQTKSVTGAPSAAAQAAQQYSFSFQSLFEGRVAALVRKPVRLCFGLNKLLLGLDAAAGLAAARDYCERAAREFAEQAKGEDALLLLQRPLSQQLELLHLWHAVMSTYLCSFLQQFKEAGGRVMAAADKGSFSVAVEQVCYEGPVKLKIPLPLFADLATGACTFDLSLPNPESAVSGLANKIRFISSAIAKAAFGKCDEECAASRHAAAVAEAARLGTDMPLTMLEELEALMTIWNAGGSERERHAAAAAHSAGQHSSSNGELSRGGSGSRDIKLGRTSSSTQRSNSAAWAAAATASITRNSLANTSRTSSSTQAASVSAPGALLGGPAAPEAAAAPAAPVAASADGRGAAAGAGSFGGKAEAGGADRAPSIAGGSSRGMIGRICMSKASFGLVLDEKRLKDLMAAGGMQDAGMLTGLLDCFGKLFTATVAPGWPTSLQESSAQMATSASLDGASTSTDDSAVPQAVVTLRNNDVTRVRANLEAASFESVVSPRIAVRLPHMLVLAIAHKFGSGSSKRLEVIHKIFTHVAEYLGRDCLDLLVCVDVAAAAVDAAGGTGPALQLLLAGAAQGPGGSTGATGSSSSSSSSSNGGACCYVINDVNLLTVLETVRLLMDYSS